MAEVTSSQRSPGRGRASGRVSSGVLAGRAGTILQHHAAVGHALVGQEPADHGRPRSDPRGALFQAAPPVNSDPGVRIASGQLGDGGEPLHASRRSSAARAPRSPRPSMPPPSTTMPSTCARVDRRRREAVLQRHGQPDADRQQRAHGHAAARRRSPAACPSGAATRRPPAARPGPGSAAGCSGAAPGRPACRTGTPCANLPCRRAGARVYAAISGSNRARSAACQAGWTRRSSRRWWRAARSTPSWPRSPTCRDG